MAKVILTPIGSFSQSAINTLNANFDRITTALESLLSRDGTAPNQMTADLDMNSQDVLNGGTGYFSELWIDGNNWPGEPPAFIEGPEGPNRPANVYLSFRPAGIRLNIRFRRRSGISARNSV